LNISDRNCERPEADRPDCGFGRRVEADRSWTVYHVFTGAPARVEGVALTGLSQAKATENMLSLNRAVTAWRREGGARISALPSPSWR
jgi:hypothetical protein